MQKHHCFSGMMDGSNALWNKSHPRPSTFFQLDQLCALILGQSLAHCRFKTLVGIKASEKCTTKRANIKRAESKQEPPPFWAAAGEGHETDDWHQHTNTHPDETGPAGQWESYGLFQQEWTWDLKVKGFVHVIPWCIAAGPWGAALPIPLTPLLFLTVTS